MIIYLTGMSGVGKSTIGRNSAELLGYDFVDTDELIVKASGMSIADIFHRFGEEYFRRLEEDVLQSISRNGNVIVATGGGMVIRDENYAYMAENGFIVCLMRESEDIFSQLETSARPLVKDGYEKFKELYDSRLPIYTKRCHELLSGGFEQIAKKFIDICRQLEITGLEGIRCRNTQL